MKRILIVGNCGAGKTTFAKQLGNCLSLPVIHLDHLFWLPGWKERDLDKFDEILAEKLNEEQWIIEGNYSRTLPMRLKYADTVIHLNYNRLICAWRVWKRMIVNDGEQADGCPHKVDFSFFRHVIWGYYRNDLQKTNALKSKSSDIKWITLSNLRETETFLRTSK